MTPTPFRVLLCPRIHAASTAAEWDALTTSWQALSHTLRLGRRPIFERLDWPGFGTTPRTPTRWTAADYHAALDSALAHSEAPTVLLGRSLGGAYALAAAHRAAQRPDGGPVVGVVAIGPTGLERLHRPPRETPNGLERLLRSDRAGTWVYERLTRPRTMHRFMRPLMGNREVPPAFMDALIAASRDPATRYAVASFVGGALNVPLHDVLRGPLPPTLLLWGRRARQTPRRELRAFMAYRHHLNHGQLGGSRRLRATEFATLGDLPHVEAPERVAMRLHTWTQDLLRGTRD